MVFNARQHTILDQLQRQGSVTIRELADQLDVSEMTVHRDLDHLMQAGRLHKVRGGAVAAGSEADADSSCITCYAPPNLRTQVVLQFQDGRIKRACCPHCGLLALARSQDQIGAILVIDFLSGRVLNGRSATYVAAPEISICCTPTVLAFDSHDMARRFQLGFGGQLFDLDAVLAFIQEAMQL